MTSTPSARTRFGDCVSRRTDAPWDRAYKEAQPEYLLAWLTAEWR
jgi:hypothetical protein